MEKHAPSQAVGSEKTAGSQTTNMMDNRVWSTTWRDARLVLDATSKQGATREPRANRAQPESHKTRLLLDGGSLVYGAGLVALVTHS